MSKQPNLPPKLEAVLIRLGLGADLNVTQAVKLPYLVDVVARHVLGKAITEGQHKTWDHGVVTKEVWHFLTKQEDSALFHLQPVRYSEERKVVIDADSPDSVLTPGEEQLVDAVAEAFGGIPATELGRLTKFMNPCIARWGSNKRASVDENAYERLSSDYQDMAEMVSRLSLKQLRETSDPRLPGGTPR